MFPVLLLDEKTCAPQHGTANMHCALQEFPLVSIIVPAYNAQRYIEATLESLICQTYPHMEIMVVDDGSTDQTADIVKKFKENDPRIQLLQQSNSGVAAARNLGIQYSRGDYIAPVDADDLCYPQKIAKLVACLQAVDSKVGVVYSWSNIIDSAGNPTGTHLMSDFEGNVFEQLLFSNFIGNASSSLIRRHCLERAGLYNTAFFLQAAQGCEDYDLYLRIAEQFEFRVVKEFLTGYRKSENSMSSNHKSMERSRHLVYRDQKMRNPWIPDIVFHWAFAYHYLWLSRIALDNGYCYDSLKYFTRAATYDKMLITNAMYFRRLISQIRKCLNRYIKHNPSRDNKQTSTINIPDQHMTSITARSCTTATKDLLHSLNPEAKHITRVDSLALLKKQRSMIVYHLLRQIRIENYHYINNTKSY